MNAEAKPKTGRKRWLVVALLLLVGIGVVLWLVQGASQKAPPTAAPANGNTTGAQPATAHSRVTVRVLARGRPLADVGVLLHHAAQSELFFTERSDENGETHFTAIPRGAYQLTTMGLGYQTRSRNVGVTGPRHQWTIELSPATAPDSEDESAEDDGEPAALGSVSGSVLDGSGNPIENAQVGASGSEVPRFTTTNSEGRFELSGLTGQQVSLFATHKSYAPSHQPNVVVGASNVRLVMQAPAQVSGQLEFNSPPQQLFVRLCHFEPAHDKEVCLKSEYSKPPRASYHLKRVPAGDFSLVFSDGETELRRLPLKVGAGEHVEVPVQRL